ncbi:MAG: hypothetical protein J6N21_07860 [Butyrivibrio sp.]|nr:hypothetical protein [Butyrivibrio sp.]
MGNNNKLTEDQLREVSGGSVAGVVIPPQRFNVGDKVLLRIYPEYGVGTVREAKVVTSGWQYTVQFDAGMMTADECEFIPA